MHGDSVLHSYDIHANFATQGPDLDAGLKTALERYGPAANIEIAVADSTRVSPPRCDLVFIDGDHTYAGVRGDYNRWRAAVRPGGHLLFHDAVGSGPFVNAAPGVERLVREIERDDTRTFARIGTAGTLVHFQRVGVGTPTSVGTGAAEPA